MRYLTTAALLLALGCTADHASAPSEVAHAEAPPTAPPAPQRTRPGLGAGSLALSEVVITEIPSPQPAVMPQDSAAPRMIIRNGRVTIEVDSVEPAIASVRLLAERVGGWVGGTGAEGGDERVRSAHLELRIPADRWDEVLQGLAPIGKLRSVHEEAQDVGEEFVDLSARLTNARRLELRLVDLLARRTGKLEDVLAVERELNRVRDEIERYEGRLRFLRTRVATSTLVVYLHEPMPLVGGPGEHVLGDAFRDAWRNFVHFLAWSIAASGVLIPVGLLVGLALVAAVRLRRMATRRTVADAEKA